MTAACLQRPASLAVAALAIVLAPAAYAHQGSTSHLSVAFYGRDAEATIVLSSRDAAETFSAATPANRLAYVASHLTLSGGGASCTATAEELPSAGGLFWSAHVAYRCPVTLPHPALRDDLVFDHDRAHHVFATVVVDGAAPIEAVLTDERRELGVDRTPTLSGAVADYARLGVAHILGGWDHLALLLALLIGAWTAGERGGWRELTLLVSAFTLAHSLTLAAAVLGGVRLPARVVEPAIALSIAWVAVENLLVERPAKRWRVAFAFGLVHGLGFAAVLRDVGMPERHLVVALVAFNGGVEVGQLAVLAVSVLALRALMQRRALAVALPRFVSGGLVMLAGYWCVTRVLHAP